VVVDSCMMPRPVLDKAKALAAKRTGIPSDRILVSATHTHSAPSTLACLGTKADPRYTPYLVGRIAEAIAAAQKNLQPAQAGWNQADAAEFTALRRWIRRPDRIEKDPFGNPTVRANMHAGRNWDNVTGESGPEDPDLTMISIQDAKGRPLAILANFSMHYFSGVKAISADYFGKFAKNLSTMLEADESFVGIMSHGCSGDIWRRDYTVRNWTVDSPPKEEQMQIDDYAKGLAERALRDYRKIKHRADLDLAMAETRMTLKYRVPDVGRLQWAKAIVAEIGDREIGDRNPKTRPEVYAIEQVILDERQETEIVLQSLRIGDMTIATTPNETYALTGLKLKALSPLSKTMVIELANGGDGYIPPPEQHFLGGYNTWAARSAGLEVQAEPIITEACLRLLEKVTAKPRRAAQVTGGPAAKAIADLKPVNWWRMDEFQGPLAIDEQEVRDGLYENGVVFYLEGPRSESFTPEQVNRCAHFAGGRLRVRLPKLGKDYTVALWFWNGMPDGARPVAGWLLSRGRDHSFDSPGDHLGLDGEGRLLFHDGKKQHLGKSTVKRWTWRQAAFTRKDQNVRVYLDGALEIEVEAKSGSLRESLFVGGRNDNDSNWEGRIDEVAIFDRALTPNEVKKLFP
ncbi:MAG: LamG-like jellyroll fold domain-containing protein, partial [Opitutales bacterium]